MHHMDIPVGQNFEGRKFKVQSSKVVDFSEIVANSLL